MHIWSLHRLQELPWSRRCPTPQNMGRALGSQRVDWSCDGIWITKVSSVHVHGDQCSQDRPESVAVEAEGPQCAGHGRFAGWLG